MFRIGICDDQVSARESLRLSIERVLRQSEGLSLIHILSEAFFIVKALPLFRKTSRLQPRAPAMASIVSKLGLAVFPDVILSRVAFGTPDNLASSSLVYPFSFFN